MSNKSIINHIQQMLELFGAGITDKQGVRLSLDVISMMKGKEWIERKILPKLTERQRANYDKIASPQQKSEMFNFWG